MENNPAMWWLIAAGVLVIMELFSGTFYLLMVAVGLLAGSAAAWFGLGGSAQAVIAGAVAAVSTLALRRSKWGKIQRTNSAQDANILLDIGQVLHVQQWEDDGLSNHSARVQYRGAQWDVQLASGAEPKAGRCVIREVRGSCLIVSPE